jgi:hypothetical protein
LDEANAVLGGDSVTARLGRNDRELMGTDLKMAQQQGQNALANTAKADDNETPREGDVLLVVHGNRTMIGLTKSVGSEYGVVKLCTSQSFPPACESRTLSSEELNRRAARLPCSRLYGDRGI